jgi:hypothetical protein
VKTQVQGRSEVARLASAAAMAVMMMGASEEAMAQCHSNAAHEMEYTTVERALVGPYAESETRYIASVAEWSVAAAEMAAGGPIETPHNVNWRKQAVLLVALGECPTYGYDIEVLGIWRVGNKATVEVRYSTPEGGLQIQAMTSPYHMVRFDKAGLSEIEICYTGAYTGTVTIQTGASDDNDPVESRMSWSDLKTRFAAN